MKRSVLTINGMAFDTSTDHVEQSLTFVPGVRRLRFDTLHRTVSVDHDEASCRWDDLVTAVRRVGYQVDACRAEPAPAEIGA